MKESRATPSFGEIELDLGEGSPSVPDLDLDGGPPSESRVAKRALEVARKLPRQDAQTRIVQGDALSALTRSEVPPALVNDDDPTSVRDGSVPSGSGVATRDDRVTALREAYARGDTEGALSLATAIRSEIPAAMDDDPFGGLIPVEEEPPVDAKDCTRLAPEGLVPSILTLTERHSIPRLLMGPREIAKLPLDPRAGFLLGNIDGMQTLEEILDVCGMPPEEAIAIIRMLEKLGAIEIE